MTTVWTVLIAGGGALAIVLIWQCVLTPRLRRFHQDDAWLGFLRGFTNLWCRKVHRVRFEGLEHLETAVQQGPVLFVGNHTSGIDPLLVQTAMDRMIYWLMAKDMMLGTMNDIWQVSRVLPVNRTKVDSGPLRRALRLLKAGECVGIFPEGRITRPAGTIRPFMDGVGMLATRGGAIVVPFLIDGTPDTDSMTVSILRPSRSRVRFLEPIRFDRQTQPGDAAEQLRQRIVQGSGWPECNEAMPLELGGP